MNLNYRTKNKKINIPKFNLKDLIIFLIPLIIFLFYLYIYNPGILTYDSFIQLHQIATGNFNNWQPFFHTFIEMVCIKIYASPVTIGVVQILSFSIIWTLICKYNRNDDLETKKYFFMQVILTFTISLIPINALYSITLWKDVLFSYLVLLLCLLIQVMLDRNAELDIGFVIIMSLIMACIAQLRFNGIYNILMLLIILCIFLYKNNKPQKMYIIIPVLTIIFIMVISSLSVVYEVEDTHKDGVFAKVMHMLADYDLNLDLSKNDRDMIHKVISKKQIKEKYNIYYTDPIRDSSNRSAYDNNRSEYIKMAIKYSIQHPKHFIKYMLGSSAMVWDITRDEDWIGKQYYINEDGANLQNSKEHFYSKKNETPTASYEDVFEVNKGTEKYNIINSFVYLAKENSLLDTLFNSPALYMYLAFILMVGIYLITKSKKIFLIYLPNLLNILTVAISTPIQDNRYLYANLLVFYLLVIIFINVLSKRESSKINYNVH